MVELPFAERFLLFFPNWLVLKGIYDYWTYFYHCFLAALLIFLLGRMSLGWGLSESGCSGTPRGWWFGLGGCEHLLEDQLIKLRCGPPTWLASF